MTERKWNNMKKLMLLGGIRYLVPVIKKAQEMGIYVITSDYLPDNIAHKYSDEYCNVNITDKEAVLECAKKLNIDGIMSFACDPGVVSASYVAEQLNLPFQGSYQSVKILQNKDLFRKFLSDNGFNVPRAKGYSNVEEAIADAGLYRWPVIVKPIDAAGSKGVSRVDTVERLSEAAEYAVAFSKEKKFMVEEFIEQKGYSSDTDCFSVDGKLVYASFDNQIFDDKVANPYAPCAFSWPSGMPDYIQKELRNDIQRLITLLNLGTSIYNVETRQGTDGKPYIMEVSPRGGGNRLAEMLRYASGVDLIENAIKAALGEDILDVKKDPVYSGDWAEVILHANKDGRFETVWVRDDIEHCVVEKDVWVGKGDIVHGFSAANDAIGTVVLRFDNQAQLKDCMDNINEYIRVIVKN